MCGLFEHQASLFHQIKSSSTTKDDDQERVDSRQVEPTKVYRAVPLTPSTSIRPLMMLSLSLRKINVPLIVLQLSLVMLWLSYTGVIDLICLLCLTQILTYQKRVPLTLTTC